MIHFGPDGQLYVAVGENANSSNAQSIDNRLGKMLRINSDGSIPADNPSSFPGIAGTTSGVNRAIWAVGLRNPFTFAVQPGTGRMFINDVGEQALGGDQRRHRGPQLRLARPAKGTARIPTSPIRCLPTTTPGASAPSPAGPSTTPRRSSFPTQYVGEVFLRGLLCRLDPLLRSVDQRRDGLRLWHLEPRRPQSPFGRKPLLPGVRRRGGLQGPVHRQPGAVDHDPSDEPDRVGGSERDVQRDGERRAAPLSYQWQKNGANISGATASSYTTPPTTAGDNGATFRCVVSNAFGSATSNAATLTVTANTAPTATITTPANNSLYSAGDTINYSGTGSDAQDGTLPASAFTWQVDFGHDTHFHPFVPATSGSTAGSFTIPTSGETSANVFYRIILTVRDSGGLTNTTFVDIRPRTSTMTLASSPSGLQLTLDGQPVTTPFSVLGVQGIDAAAGGAQPADSGGAELDLQRVVGRRRRRARHHDADDEYDLHGDVSGRRPRSRPSTRILAPTAWCRSRPNTSMPRRRKAATAGTPVTPSGVSGSALSADSQQRRVHQYRIHDGKSTPRLSGQIREDRHPLRLGARRGADRESASTTRATPGSTVKPSTRPIASDRSGRR